jgi:hypothetical protein
MFRKVAISMTVFQVKFILVFGLFHAIRKLKVCA